MTSLSSKFLEMFRNLKSDAVPSAPRPRQEEEVENIEDNSEVPQAANITELSDEEQEEIVIEPEEIKKESKKHKKNFFNSSKKGDGWFSKPPKDAKRDSTSSVNVQAMGNVVSIVNSSNVRYGNDFVYVFGQNMKQNAKMSNHTNNYTDDHIKKTPDVIELMKADLQPDHEYLNCISKNLGKNWYDIFIALGYSKNEIETEELEYAQQGIKETRYQLLLDWVRNDDIGTLGHLSSLLWENGEKELVVKLASIYMKNKNDNKKI